MAAMNDILTTNEDIDAVFLHSDCMLAGVISGLTQSEKLKTLDDPEHVMIVSIDGAGICDGLYSSGICGYDSG